jgi:hypothetical protein
LKCNKDNHEWYIFYYNFINKNVNCVKCSNVSKPSQIEVNYKINKKCKEKDYILLDKFEYINSKTKNIHLKCNKDNHEWYSTYENFILSDRNCLKCSGKFSITQKEAEENVNNKCKEKNYTLLEKFIYKNNRIMIHLKCNIDNHEWYVMYRNFINSDKCCIICGNKYKKSENEIIKLLKINNIRYIYQYKSDWLGRLSLDFYLPEYNIGIEYQGLQHFIPIKYFGGEKTFNNIINRDKRKYNLCKSKLILLYVSYEKNIPENYLDKIITSNEELIETILNNI